MSQVKAAIFASGSGSNFQAIMETENLGCHIGLLVCDQPHALVLDKADDLNVPTFTFNASNYDSKAAYERDIKEQLEVHEIDWIFLAGYMRIIGQTLLKAYEGRIVNIHPSLLPSFPGKDAIGQAFRAKVETTGVTIHYVDEGMDTGPIIYQERVVIHPNDTQSDLEKRIHKVEHRIYPNVIRELCQSNK